MERKLVLNFFGKNPSILKKFLLINFIIFSVIGLFTVFYLTEIEPNLVKKKTSKHAQIIDNTINNIERLNNGDWTQLHSIYAYGLDTYQTVVETLQDSSATTDGMETYRVIAAMEEGNFVSLDDENVIINNTTSDPVHVISKMNDVDIQSLTRSILDRFRDEIK